MIGMSISLYQIIQLFMFQEVDKITQDISVKTFSAPVSPSMTDEIPQRRVSTMNEAGEAPTRMFLQSDLRQSEL